MIVCICNAIRENQLRDAARAGPGDVEHVYRQLGCHAQCRQCFEEAGEILQEERCCVA
ncbi:(2Fe-2S)-binding protein [Croceicoccus sp. F390]|uniref:Bacterioferritin-associated ferredoxin n=1 Tax=Croceicoccus esteveae TaxID=3075597 RepID=A0ABU2ZG62_9SPHN|nr:(2Fe-2S)-binding protein [Croceicoccus sp. F390]MDT0575592.1 (2Fe-2S)-binding protein [Croceicoccus sp. F390]